MSNHQKNGLARKLKSSLAISALAIATATSFSSATAQISEENATADADDTRQLDTVQVTGTRLQNQQSITTKRNADAIIDSISQDEIGRQPDFNIADAVRRAPGVSTVRDEEEGLFLSIRGLNPDFTFVTLDGGALASLDAGNPGRRVSVEAIPSTVISRTDIQKSRTAAMDGNTIGGQVNFTTRSAFDSDGLFAVASGSIGKFTADDFDREDNDPAIRLDGTISNTFGDNDQFGFVLAGSYFSRAQDEERTLQFYDFALSAPDFPIWNGVESPQVRLGGFGKLEYRPNDRISMALSGNYFEQNDEFQRASIVLGAGSVTSSSPGVGTGTGLFAHNLESLVTDDGKEQYGINYHLDYEISEDTEANFRASFSRGRAFFGSDMNDRSDIRFVYNGPAGANDYTYQLRGTGSPPLITFVDPATASDTDNFRLSRITSNIRDTSGTVLDLEGSFDHDFGDSGYSMTAGVRYRSLSRRVNDDNMRFDYIGTTDQLLSQFGMLSNSFTPPGAPQNAPIIDNDSVIAFLNSNPTLFNDRTSEGSILGNDFEVEEGILSGYAAIGYDDGPLSLNAGLRIEATDVEAMGFSNIVTTDGSYQQVTDSNDYVNLLPSASVSYDVSEELKLRAAYSRGLGRANLPDLRVSPSVNEVTGVTTISGGNTALDPRVSDNFDLSLEYYFDGGRSIASVAVFHKSISDEIFQLDRTENTAGGPIVIRQPVNAEETTLNGVELNLVKDRLDFLPGFFSDFGVSANYTWVDADSSVLASDGTARGVGFLVEQPDELLNAALFYQKGPFDGRISYNYTGRYANSISTGNPDSDDFIDAFETVDAQLRWRFSEQLTMIVDGRNLTNEKSIELTGPNAAFIEDYSEFGSAYFLGLTYNY